MNVGKVKFENDLKQTISQAVAEIGGFEKFIKKGDVVFLKPNFNTADPYPGSSDFEFVKTMVELSYAHGAKMVLVGDSSTMTLNTRRIMQKLGIFELQNLDKPARVYVFEEGKWLRKKIEGAKYQKCVMIPEIIERVDKLILLPCLKTHKQAQFTGALKLSVGFMKPVQRLRLHLKNLQEKVAEINKVIHPHLIVMDARKCFINQGPSRGETREPNLVLASDDRVAIDIQGIKIIQSYKGNSLEGIDPYELPQVKRAVEMGIK